MKQTNLQGALYGLAIGDAMGAPTELRNTDQICALFGGYVTDFKQAPSDTFARDYPAGTVTDDFSLSYHLMTTLCQSDFIFNDLTAKTAVISWGDDPVYFDKFAGPTTRLAVDNMRNGLPTDVDAFGLINYNGQATNGGAMKTAPIALLASGNWEKALAYTITLCQPTHYNSTAISGAAAIALAITEAQKETATLDSIYEAAMWGAKAGREELESREKISVAPHIDYKIQEAIKIGSEAATFDELLVAIDRKVGTNLQVTESVPAVFAIIAGTKGDLMESIYAAANVGGDTDTIGAMVGAILGAYHGLDAIPPHLIEAVKLANPTLAIEQIITDFTDGLLDLSE